MSGCTGNIIGVNLIKRKTKSQVLDKDPIRKYVGVLTLVKAGNLQNYYKLMGWDRVGKHLPGILRSLGSNENIL